MGATQVRVVLWSLFGITALVAIVCISPLESPRISANQRKAISTLKTVVTAQNKFRASDSDENSVKVYWRSDLAGLSVVNDAKLIKFSIAGADDSQVTVPGTYSYRSPKSGYWFRALRFSDELPDKPDPDRFAAGGYPDEYGLSGRWSFIISHDDVLYRKDLGEEGAPAVYPVRPEAEGWETLD